MKKLTIILLAFLLSLVSSYAFASVYGTWNMESIWKSTLKQGKAKPIIVTENLSDVWTFQDDNSLKSNYFIGTWTQKAKSASFTVTIGSDVMGLFLQNKLASSGLPATVTIKKLRIFGSEKNIYGSGKKDWTIKGKYEIQADLVFPDLSTGKLAINGSFTGTLPYETSEYFPLGLGDSWTTKETQTRTTQEGEVTEVNTDTTSVFGTEKIKGVIAMKRGNTETGSYDLMTNTNGLNIYKTYDTDYEGDVLVNETFDTFNPPLMNSPPKLSVGTRGTFKSTMTHKESSGFKATAKITVEMIVEGIEDVTVPAGTFEDCLKISIKRDSIVKKLNHEELSLGTYWFAKGIGMVKREETNTMTNNNVVEETEISTEELLSATVGGVNYP
jgi:hypothetical protein